MARIAVGLNFANKAGLQDHTRYLALIYAAHQLKEYYKFKKMPLPDNGVPLVKPIDSVQSEVGGSIEDWQEIWRHCSEFNTEYVFILVVGNGLSKNTEHLATLGRLPWSMVMDFDPNSQSSGLMAAAKSELTKRRGFHSLTPEQEVDVNFDQGALWLMVRGSSDRPDTLVTDFNTWRYGKIPAIASHLDNLRKQTAPRQLQVLFMFTEENERKYFEAIAERVKEVFYEGNPKLILCCSPNLSVIGDEDTFINVDCTPDNLMEGLIRHLVMDVGDIIIYLPRREQNLESDKIERALFGFTSYDDLLNIGEDLEIIHPGLGVESALGTTDGFLRGNTISWIELERGYDVKLEMYPDFR